MQATTPTTPTQSKPRIRFLGGTRYVVESKSQPGIGRQVDTLTLRCSCPAGQHQRRCWHLTTALAYEDWRKRERARAKGASAPVPPVSASVPATPAVAPVGDWHTSAAGDRHASAETGMRALQVAFGE